jgi:DNA-binding MarR family transcriptional regulator
MKERSKPVSPLTEHLGFWLRFVSNAVSHAFALKLAKRGVTGAEWVALRALYDEDVCAPSALADRLGMTRGAISKLADRLEAKDLVTRAADPEDRRSHRLRLTAKGHKLTPVLAELADQNDAEFFSHLTPEERSGIEGAMREIVRLRGLRAAPVD